MTVAPTPSSAGPCAESRSVPGAPCRTVPDGTTVGATARTVADEG
ncbi:hypothetical protein ACT4S2_04210 [Kocuria turfanensis]